jgi:hypothetical protein
MPTPFDNVDEAILSVLNENPFTSVRKLSRLTHLPLTTVYRRLTSSLEFTARHLRWMLHTLSDTQKAQRVTLSRQLLLTTLKSDFASGVSRVNVPAEEMRPDQSQVHRIS